MIKKMICLWALLSSITLLGFQKVDINTADIEQISLLPGVGKTLASEIFAYRVKKGFLSENDLEHIPGITKKKVAGFAQQIIFSRPKALAKKQSIASKKILWVTPEIIPLSELEDKAIKLAGLERSFDDSLLFRNQKSGLIPKIDFDLDVGNVRSITEKKEDYPQSRKGQDIGFGLKATFDLPRLLFSSTELDIENLKLKREQIKEGLIADIHKNYFDYLRISNQMALEQDETRFKELQIQLQQSQAFLDSKSQKSFTNFLHKKNLEEL